MSPPTTPRSRTPSRVGTPLPALSRLAPLARPAPSVSSRVHSHGTTSSIQTPTSDYSRLDAMVHGSHEGASSSASSALTVEAPTPEGMLVQEVDVEVIDGEQGTASAIPTPRGNDEESKQHLREQLRRTLNKKESSHDLAQRSRKGKGKAIDIHEIPHSPSDQYPPRQYFVLTEAGKPVFISRQEDEASDNFTSTIGVMQALVSIFLDDGDKLRCINAGNTRITFLLRPPLYYACVSSWGEAESVQDAVPSRIPAFANPQCSFCRTVTAHV